MTKKILILIFVLLLGAIGFIGYNFYKNVKQPISSNAIIAVPQNAALLLKEKNFTAFYKKIASTNIIWEELTNNTATFKSIKEQTHFLDSVLAINEVGAVLSEKSMLMSMHLSGANSYDFVFYFSTLPNIDEKNVLTLLKSKLQLNPSARNYDGKNIYSITKNDKKLFFAFDKSIFAISHSSLLIEDVIRQLKSETSLLDDQAFNTILSTTGEVPDGNIFINHQRLPKILAQPIHQQDKEKVAKATNYASWSALDISLKSNSIMLNGFTSVDAQQNAFLSLFADQTNTLGGPKINLTSIVPANTALLYYYSFSNSEKFFKNRKSWLKQNNTYFEYEKYIDAVSGAHSIDIEAELVANVGNELAFVITEPLNENLLGNRFVLFRVNSLEKAKENLNAIQQKTNLKSTTEDEQKPQQLNFQLHFSQLFGKPFFDINQPYYLFIDDYLVFGETETGINEFYKNYVAEKTLQKDENFQAFSDQLSSSASIFVYNNIARSVHWYKTFMDEPFIPEIDSNIEFIRKFEAIAFQVSPQKDQLFYNNIYFKYNPVYKQDTRTLWEVLLDTTATAPQIVLNHQTQTKEVIVQDVNNKLYLISTNGKILWTKQLSERIHGQIHQVDIFKNNKLQLLFSTKSKIYLLDRNGKNVNKFPVELKAEATTPVSPLDYDNNRNYRILIGCSNNIVYNYDSNGDLVKGWEYDASKSSPSGIIKHFIIGNKDYIVIPTKNGSIKVVQRNGKDRLQLKSNLPTTANEVFLKVEKDLASSYLICADSSGNVIKLFFNDKLETLKLISENKTDFYSFSPTNISPTANSSSHVFAIENQVIVSDNSANQLFKTEIPETIIHQPLLFSLPDKSKKIGVVTASTIYLINDAGTIESDFPLSGSTPFMIDDINNDNTLNLVVGDKKLIFLYNLK
mgnify:FL=1